MLKTEVTGTHRACGFPTNLTIIYLEWHIEAQKIKIHVQSQCGSKREGGLERGRRSFSKYCGLISHWVCIITVYHTKEEDSIYLWGSFGKLSATELQILHDCTPIIIAKSQMNKKGQMYSRNLQ